jgi:hypothetical protein
MRWLLAFVILTAPLLARDKTKVRDWQEGTVQCLRTSPPVPLLIRSETVLVIVTTGADGIRFTYSVFGFGKAFLRQEPGSGIRFVLDNSRVWIKDAEGIEHRGWLRGRSVLHDGDKLTCDT